MPTHRCHFKANGYKGRTICFHCECGADKERPATRIEIRYLERRHTGIDGLHRVWYSFCRKFKEVNSETYAKVGWELMQGVAKWAKRYPNDVTLVRVDDSSHMNSDLILIDHKTKDQYMGITVVFIPQDRAPPSEFFMYPGARDDLIRTLNVFRKRAEKHVKAQRAAEKEDQAFWKSLKP